MDENKPGFKTSEFWMATVASVVTILNDSGVLGSFQLPTQTILGVAGIAITYILGRSVVKLKS